MFVGHGLLAFSIAALLGRRLGLPARRALSIALLAGAFATLPDVDILYAPVGLLGGVSGVFDAAEAFWQTGNVVHRAITHSLPVGVVAALAFATWRYGLGRPRPTGVVAAGSALALAVGLVAVATGVTGGLAGVVMALFLAGGFVVATVATRYGLSTRAVLGAGLLGLLSHPFGDLFTGEPPALLYPLDATLLSSRVTLATDPTLHLLAAFGLELATVWLAAAVYVGLRGERLRDQVRPRAAVGAGYAAAALALPAPTLETSYHFVFSILAVGAVGTVDLERHVRGSRRDSSVLGRVLADPATAAVTGLAAITLAGAGYAVAYLLF